MRIIKTAPPSLTPLSQIHIRPLYALLISLLDVAPKLMRRFNSLPAWFLVSCPNTGPKVKLIISLSSPLMCRKEGGGVRDRLHKKEISAGFGLGHK